MPIDLLRQVCYYIITKGKEIKQIKNIKKIIGVKMDKANKVILDKWKEWAKEEGRNKASKNDFANYYANSYEEYLQIWEVVECL